MIAGNTWTTHFLPFYAVAAGKSDRGVAVLGRGNPAVTRGRSPLQCSAPTVLQPQLSSSHVPLRRGQKDQQRPGPRLLRAPVREILWARRTSKRQPSQATVVRSSNHSL